MEMLCKWLLECNHLGTLRNFFPQIFWICIWLNPWIQSPGCRGLTTSWIMLVTRTTEKHSMWRFSYRSCQHVCTSPVRHGGICGTIRSKYKVLCCSRETGYSRGWGGQGRLCSRCCIFTCHYSSVASYSKSKIYQTLKIDQSVIKSSFPAKRSFLGGTSLC